MNKLLRTLTKPRLINIGVPIEESVKISLPQIAVRVLISIITAGWITSIPFYLFVIFMHENEFFSYDFFIDGVFGIYTFIIVSALFLVFLSLSLYGFIIFAKLGLTEQRRNNKNSSRGVTWLFFLVSCALHLIFFIMALEHGKPKIFIWIISISIIFCAFFTALQGMAFGKTYKTGYHHLYL